MITEATPVATIPRIDRSDMREVATEEYARFLTLLRSLEDAHWTRRTDCTEWDVRAVVAHIVGTAESSSLREQLRVVRAGKKVAKADGVDQVDGINAVQVRERAGAGNAELVARLELATPAFIRFRERLPSVLRLVRVPSPAGPVSLGQLVDVIYTRDVWLHRVDISRAVGRDMVLTDAHDGRIVTDVVAEWAARHAQPFTLHLEGVAGGIFAAGDGGEPLRLDAVEFCRIVSGREKGAGLLATPVVF